jgi:hypothetical protein
MSQTIHPYDHGAVQTEPTNLGQVESPDKDSTLLDMQRKLLIIRSRDATAIERLNNIIANGGHPDEILALVGSIEDQAKGIAVLIHRYRP